MRSKSNQNKWMRLITLPIRFLKKGRDLYVKRMMDFAQKPRYGSSYMMGGSMNYGQHGLSGLPKSFSTSALTPSWACTLDGDDLRELIRANSTTTSSSNDPNSKLRVEMELYLKQLIKEQQMKQQMVPRSCSVGMGKIDEDKPFEEEEGLDDNNGVKKNEMMFPRSRSNALRV